MKRSLLLTVSFAVACYAGSAHVAAADEVAKKTPTRAVAKKRAVKNVVPVFVLSGAITEKPVADDNPFNLGGAGGESLHELIKRLHKAKDDDNVPAIVMQLNSLGVGRAQLEELSRVLQAFKATGKKIHIHSDMLTTGQLAFVSSASEISMVPTGYLFITGMYGEQVFLRKMLDTIGVTPDYITCGSYKSAGEMFMRNEPSAEAEKMTKWLYDGLYENMLEVIAKGRGVEVKQARAWIDQGLFTSEQAVAEGIIDVVEHRQSFEDRLRKEYGEEVKFDRKYGKKTSGQIDLSSPFGIMNFYADLLAPSRPRRSTKPGVGIVYLDGAIMPGTGGGNPLLADSAAFSGVIRKALDEAAEDDAIKAVVFRVNSPGGSAVASEVILNATLRIAAKKPLIISMGNVAASGGYYVACGSDMILAEDSTITGSIGVVSGKFATTPMWNKLGISFSPIQRGKNASLLSSAKVFTDSERQAMQSYMDSTYAVFKGHVTKARGKNLKKPIEEIAGGRVYTGRQALELGLVDRIGGLDDAIRIAAQKADLPDGYDVRVIPRQKGFMELMMSDMSGGGDNNPHLSITRNSTSMNPILEAALPLLQNLDPARVLAIKHAMLQLTVLQTEGVALSMPVMTITN